MLSEIDVIVASTHNLDRIPDHLWREKLTALLRQIESRTKQRRRAFTREIDLYDALPQEFRRLADEHDLFPAIQLFIAGYSAVAARKHLDENRQARERLMLHEAACLYRAPVGER